jgi:hypothetical protein
LESLGFGHIQRDQIAFAAARGADHLVPVGLIANIQLSPDATTGPSNDYAHVNSFGGIFEVWDRMAI